MLIIQINKLIFNLFHPLFNSFQDQMMPRWRQPEELPEVGHIIFQYHHNNMWLNITIVSSKLDVSLRFLHQDTLLLALLLFSIIHCWILILFTSFYRISRAGFFIMRLVLLLSGVYIFYLVHQFLFVFILLDCAFFACSILRAGFVFLWWDLAECLWNLIVLRQLLLWLWYGSTTHGFENTWFLLFCAWWRSKRKRKRAQLPLAYLSIIFCSRLRKQILSLCSLLCVIRVLFQHVWFTFFKQVSTTFADAQLLLFQNSLGHICVKRSFVPEIFTHIRTALVPIWNSWFTGDTLVSVGVHNEIILTLKARVLITWWVVLCRLELSQGQRVILTIGKLIIGPLVGAFSLRMTIATKTLERAMIICTRSILSHLVWDCRIRSS